MHSLFTHLALVPSRSLTVLFVVFVLQGCGGQSVLFSEEDTGIDEESEEAVYRIFFDREGNIYPSMGGESKVQVDTTVFGEGPGSGYLQRYFCEHREQLKYVAAQAGMGKQYKPYECELRKDAEEGEPNAIDHGHWGDWMRQWTNIQEGLLENQSQQIAEFLQEEDNSELPLIVLIHGYNNELCGIKNSYKEVRKTLQNHTKYREKSFVFLDIYWDGFAQKVPLNIWGPAQYTGPIVGARMRKLLKAIESERPVRVLTHSSGAFVVGSLIGDSRKALTLWRKAGICDREHQDYDQMVCLFKDIMMSKELSSDTRGSLSGYDLIKSKDLRVGMIAPATSSWTFIGGEETEPEGGRGLLKPSGTLRLIVGQHEDDFANTKLVGLECFKGVTTLGVRKTSFCEIKDHIGNEHYGLKGKVDVQRVDFKTKGKERHTEFLFRADHGLAAYLERDKASEFLSLFLDADPAPSENAGRADNICPENYTRSCESWLHSKLGFLN